MSWKNWWASEYDGREGLNLLMVDDEIPAGAKLY